MAFPQTGKKEPLANGIHHILYGTEDVTDLGDSSQSEDEIPLLSLRNREAANSVEPSSYRTV